MLNMLLMIEARLNNHPLHFPNPEHLPPVKQTMHDMPIPRHLHSSRLVICQRSNLLNSHGYRVVIVCVVRPTPVGIGTSALKLRGELVVATVRWKPGCG